MKTSKSPGYVKILLPLLAVVIALLIFKNGYQFGQWLNAIFSK